MPKVKDREEILEECAANDKAFAAKLVDIQSRLHAPKSQKNAFGNYNYRNCEDILEAVKPLLSEHGLSLTISDDISLIGDRFYVRAEAYLSDGESYIENVAFARESLDKKGMDASQITGAASSYARKYALNGLFLIDDTKDADSMDNTAKQYTEEQKYRFMQYFKGNDALRFYLFSKTLSEGAYNDLYNSFPKGSKTEAKKTCNGLEMGGAAIAKEIIETVADQVDAGDVAYKENLEGLEPDEKQILAKMFSKETLDKMKNFKEGS